MNQHKMANGRMKVYIPTGQGKAGKDFVDEMVLTAFLMECPEGFKPRHIDGNNSNSHIDNLEWVLKVGK